MTGFPVWTRVTTWSNSSNFSFSSRLTSSGRDNGASIQFRNYRCCQNHVRKMFRHVHSTQPSTMFETLLPRPLMNVFGHSSVGTAHKTSKVKWLTNKAKKKKTPVMSRSSTESFTPRSFFGRFFYYNFNRHFLEY